MAHQNKGVYMNWADWDFDFDNSVFSLSSKIANEMELWFGCQAHYK